MSLRNAIFVLAIGTGLVLASEARAASLVTNGGFETGDFTGWTVSGTGIAIDQFFPNNGCCDAVFGSLTTDLNPGILSQLITTNPGGSYNLQFALLDEAEFSGDSFIVTFGGFTATITGDEAPATYTLFQYFIPGGDITSASTNLTFEGFNDPAIGQDLNLDDVSLSCTANCAPSATPIPSAWSLFATVMLLWFAMAFYRKRGLTLLKEPSALCG